MTKKIKVIRNEPLLQSNGDKMPVIAKVNFQQLPLIVKARLEIEKNIAFCPVGKQRPAIKWTSLHKQALRIMMLESDSPLSASIRVFSVGVAGHLNTTGSIPELIKIFSDKNDDLRTRINATQSLLQFAEKGKIKNTRQIFESSTPQIRFIALKHALNSKRSSLYAQGMKYLLKEKNKEIIEILNRRYETLSMKYSTQAKKKTK
jgi:hypothetical protein